MQRRFSHVVRAAQYRESAVPERAFLHKYPPKGNFESSGSLWYVCFLSSKNKSLAQQPNTSHPLMTLHMFKKVLHFTANNSYPHHPCKLYSTYNQQERHDHFIHLHIENLSGTFVKALYNPAVFHHSKTFQKVVIWKEVFRLKLVWLSNCYRQFWCTPVYSDTIHKKWAKVALWWCNLMRSSLCGRILFVLSWSIL